MRDYILYHSGCYDGFGGAYVAWKCFGNKAHYLPVRHGNPPPDLPDNSQAYIIDFCYAKEILLEMLKRHRVTVLDHHRSVQLPLEELREEAIRSMADNRDMGFRVEFDLNRSGAMLAWNHFYPEEPAPELIHYIQDRDLQRFSLPDSQDVHYALCGYPMDFEVWDTLSVEQLRVEGKAINSRMVPSPSHHVKVLPESAKTISASLTFAFVGSAGGCLWDETFIGLPKDSKKT